MDSPQLLSIVKGLLGREGGTYIVYQNSRDHFKKWQSWRNILYQCTVCPGVCHSVKRWSAKEYKYYLSSRFYVISFNQLLSSFSLLRVLLIITCSSCKTQRYSVTGQQELCVAFKELIERSEGYQSP